jgi:CubicO group peptidase (beta-lactamase class C family)
VFKSQKMKVLLFAVAFFCHVALNAQTTLTQRFDSLTQAYARNGFHGVVLVAKADTVLYEKAYGYANFERKIPHNVNTLFKTESVGKMFTATAILQLVESGKLSLSQTVKDLLPELAIRNADKITVDQLLRHTSGLQSPWDHPQWVFKKDYSKAELVKIVEEVPLAFDVPGTRMYYSNSGYCVLGWIVEKLSGQAFDKYLQEHFFSPLQMTTTRHLNDTAMPVQTGAQPYRIVSSKRHILFSRGIGPKAGAAGGWISTARDLYRFVQALHSGRLLNPSALEIMRTANGAAPKDSAYRFYAYGLESFVNQQVKGASLYGHNGGGAGFSIDAFFEAQSGYTVVSCTNLYQNSRPIMYNYFRAALEQPLQPVMRPLAIRVYDLMDSVGTENFFSAEKAHLAALGVKPQPGFFADMSDAMDAAGDSTGAGRWLLLGRQYFPEDGFLLLVSGDLEISRGNKAGAKAFFDKAKTIAERTKDDRMLQAAKEKTAAL